MYKAWHRIVSNHDSFPVSTQTKRHFLRFHICPVYTLLLQVHQLFPLRVTAQGHRFLMAFVFQLPPYVTIQARLSLPCFHGHALGVRAIISRPTGLHSSPLVFTPSVITSNWQSKLGTVLSLRCIVKSFTVSRPLGDTADKAFTRFYNGEATVGYGEQINIPGVCFFLLLGFWCFVVVAARVIGNLTNQTLQAAHNARRAVLDRVLLRQRSYFIFNVNYNFCVPVHTLHHQRAVKKQC